MCTCMFSELLKILIVQYGVGREGDGCERKPDPWIIFGLIGPCLSGV